MDADYNDIQNWHYKDLVKVFGAKEGTYRTYQVKTKEEVNSLFKDPQFNSADVLQFVELYIPKKDAPRALIMTADASARLNKKIA